MLSQRELEKQKFNQQEFVLIPNQIPNFSGQERISDVKCGPSHSIAISGRGAVYSWGEGSKGKLGLGFSESLRLVQNQHFPKRIIKGLAETGKPVEPIASAGLGKSLTLIHLERGDYFVAGKGEFQKIRHDDYRRHSYIY